MWPHKMKDHFNNYNVFVYMTFASFGCIIPVWLKLRHLRKRCRYSADFLFYGKSTLARQIDFDWECAGGQEVKGNLRGRMTKVIANSPNNPEGNKKRLRKPSWQPIRYFSRNFIKEKNINLTVGKFWDHKGCEEVVSEYQKCLDNMLCYPSTRCWDI